MENQNVLRIVLSLAILAAFFLPLYNDVVYGVSVSSWALLTEGVKNIGSNELPTSQLVLRFCLGVVLVCSIVILAFSVLRKQTSIFLNLLPLLLMIGFIIFNTTQSKENVGQALQSFGTGFYIMFLSSFLLPFSSVAVTPVNS